MFLRALIAFLFVTSAHAQEVAAPFGLTWGASAAEVQEALGVVPSAEPLWGRLSSFRATRAPVTPPDTDVLLVAVDPDHGMGRVIWFSTPIEGDAYGSRGKEKYDELKAILTEKYGKPSNNMERTGVKLWKDRDEFYQCLGYDGCGIWMSVWDVGAPATTIGLQIKGIRRGEGVLIMTYEGPNWSDILAAVKAGENKAKKDAF